MNILKVIFLSFIIVFFILNSIFYALLQYPCKDVTEIKNRKKYFSSKYPDPVDVVYTWVNGSDTDLITQLDFHKKILYQDKNLHMDGVRHRLSCPYPICGYNNHVLLSPPPSGHTSLDHFLEAASIALKSMVNSSTNFTIKFVSNIVQSSISRRSGIIVHSCVDISQLFSNQSDVSLYVSSVAPYHFTLSQVFIAAEASKVGVAIDDCAFVHGLKEMKDASIESSWRNVISRQTSMNITLIKASSTSFLAILPTNITFKAFCDTMVNETKVDNFKVSQAFLVVDTVLATVLADISESRYQDNEELKYSLRSLDSFLTFYRHIFIVTNGQVPYWLDQDHPKITLVSHHQIFPNKSHLPTFNSAAIEANLHNIPGLAPHFIYLNDDVFFGQPVYEEDFFSLSTGYKVYLGWSVPDCVDRCPNSWLADGFCDHECNVPECHFDAGDCVKTHGKVGIVNFGSIVNQSLQHRNHLEGLMFPAGAGTCSQGCNHNWLADRYCDSSCNVAMCGYDLGDCGDGNLLTLPVLPVTKTMGSMFVVDNGTVALVLDLRPLINDSDNVTSATIDDVIEVISSSYTVKYRLLVVLLASRQTCVHCYNLTNQAIEVHVSVFSGNIAKYNISTGLVLNSLLPTSTSTTMTFTDSRTSESTVGYTSEPTRVYDTPGTVPFPRKVNMSEDISIDRLELERPVDMSHYRLLLEDGLISLEGYHHLIGRLWTSVKQPHSRDVHITALQPDLRLEDLSWGFLPWERPWSTRLSVNQSLPDDHTATDRSTMKKPLDLYAESLRHSNRLLSTIFGISQRRVPGHGPHFISTSILQSAHRKFKDHWFKTSGHKFRSPFDVQFAFSYFYYLMSETSNVTVEELLNRVDTDNSRSLDMNELRSLALALSSNDSITNMAMKEFITQIRNRCTDIEAVERGLSVNVTVLAVCLNVSESVVPRYRFTTVDDADLAFIMISTNHDKVIHDLDFLRKKSKKFFCLNDNLPSNDDTSEVVALVRRDLHDFLTYMFPFPSQFEKSPRRRSSFSPFDLSRTLVLVCICALVAILLLVRLSLSKRLYYRVCRRLCSRR